MSRPIRPRTGLGGDKKASKMVAVSDTGKSVIGAATRGSQMRNFTRANDMGVWSDAKGKTVGYSREEDSKMTPVGKVAATGKLVAAYSAQRKKAGTKGY